MSSRNTPMEGKQAILNYVFAQTHDVGSVGCIVRHSIVAAVIQDLFGMPWPSCHRLSMRHTSAPWVRSNQQTRHLRTDYFSVSPSLPGLCVSKNWQSFSHL